MKFRKKPVVVEAEQWFIGKEIEGLHYGQDFGITHVFPHIETLEGRMIVREGDWIITGINGEKYPCKPDIFEKTYEKVID